jgi:mRNA interferase MazF
MSFDPSKIKRGDIVVVDLQGALGGEKKGNNRPCVVVQNDIGNEKSPMTIVAPLTDVDQYKKLPVQVLISAEESGENGKESVVECGHIRTIDKSRISAVVARLPNEAMSRVDKALKISLSLR